MKPLRVIAYTVIGISSLIAGAILYDSYFSTRAVIGKANERKARQLKIGMSAGAVFRIMGPPEESYSENSGSSSLVYEYPSSNDNYVPISIFFDSGRIREIDFP